jgi:hypothetical protein
MKRILLVLSVMMTLLSACAAPAATATSVPEVTEVFVLPSATEPASAPTEAPIDGMPSMKLPAPSFDSQTYINGTAGFALDYPASWIIKEVVIGERGSQVQFLSSPDLADAVTLPEGATRVIAAIYRWDPKNDLAAYVAHQKTAWEASGSKILEEEPVTLELGLPAVQLTVQTPQATVVYLVTAIGDQYLVLSGEGDLELAKEIMQRVRPISR